MAAAETADGLPADVLGAIRRCLPIVDYIRFPAVCRAWRSAAREQESIPHPPRGHPWLFTASCHRPVLYAIDCHGDTGGPKVHEIPLPDDLRRHQIVSSVGHRLLFENTENSPSNGIRLFNPFSPSQSASLPPSSTVRPRPVEHRHLYSIHTVVSDAGSGIAFALMRRGVFRIAYTSLDRNPSGRWIDLSHLITSDNKFEAAILYKPGLFCAVEDTGNEVVAFDFSSAPDVRTVDMTFDLPPGNFTDTGPPDDWCCYQSSRFVNAGPSLFLVRWRTILKKDGVPKRREIDVYRLDDDERWVPVKSLGDLSFFVGLNGSISMSATDFPALKGGRIYLPHDATQCVTGWGVVRPFRCHFFGDGIGDGIRNVKDYSEDDDYDEEVALGYHLVYNLEDESWGSFYDVVHHRTSVWMIPHAVVEMNSQSKTHSPKFKENNIVTVKDLT